MNRRGNQDKPLDEMSVSELEKIKLVAEIKSIRKPIFLDPSFWTFIIAVFATIFSLESGLFDTKGEILKLETLKLEQKKDTLTRQIQTLKEDNVSLIIENRQQKLTLDTIYKQIHYLNQKAKPILDEYNKTHP